MDLGFIVCMTTFSKGSPRSAHVVMASAKQWTVRFTSKSDGIMTLPHEHHLVELHDFKVKVDLGSI